MHLTSNPEVCAKGCLSWPSFKMCTWSFELGNQRQDVMLGHCCFAGHQLQKLVALVLLSWLRTGTWKTFYHHLKFGLENPDLGASTVAGYAWQLYRLDWKFKGLLGVPKYEAEVHLLLHILVCASFKGESAKVRKIAWAIFFTPLLPLQIATGCSEEHKDWSWYWQYCTGKKCHSVSIAHMNRSIPLKAQYP